MNNNEYSFKLIGKVKGLEKDAYDDRCLVTVYYSGTVSVHSTDGNTKVLRNYLKQLKTDKVQGLKFMYASFQSMYLLQLFNSLL